VSTVGWILLLACAATAVTVAAVADRRGGGRVALRRRFGSEYDRAVVDHGDRRAAERYLTQIIEKRNALTLTPLSQPEREVFAARWETLQTRFVDDPPGATHQADALITEVMRSRGYPATAFAERAYLLAADDPALAAGYRDAHANATRGGDAGQPPDTERLRTAFVRYRGLFDRLSVIGVRPDEPDPPPNAAQRSRATARSAAPPRQRQAPPGARPAA
jgi:hypothetical protein